MTAANEDLRGNDGYPFRDAPLKAASELEALRRAKAKQDRSHAQFDIWVADTIAALTSRH